MNVAFVVNDLQLSGGVGVVVEHARQLRRRHGMDAVLVLARPQDEHEWHHAGLADVPVLDLHEARGRHFHVAVATWWETAMALFDLRAHRYAYFVQSLEDRFYLPDDPNRIGAAATHDLPVAFLTEARWIADTLEQMRPELHVALVRNGIDKAVFAPLSEPVPATGGPLRILVEGRPAVWFKGVPEALEATGNMTRPRHVTLVSPDPPPAGLYVDRRVGPVTQAQMAALYADAHVVLKLSRVEGMYGPPLEGFHLGATAVTTPVTGHEEYVVHGWNALVVDWDDVRGTARALDLLATDRMLLHELRHNALQTARGWPSWNQQGAVMAAALHRIAMEPPPEPHAGIAALLGDLQASMRHQGEVVRKRDELRYRAAPLLAVQRRLEREDVAWAAAPLRRVWGAARRRLR